MTLLLLDPMNIFQSLRYKKSLVVIVTISHSFLETLCSLQIHDGEFFFDFLKIALDVVILILLLLSDFNDFKS